jgi:DNA-binding GntR family transcriptional regulator
LSAVGDLGRVEVAHLLVLDLGQRHTAARRLLRVDPGVLELGGLDLGQVLRASARRMYADDEPMQLATSYVPWSLAEAHR